MEPDLELDLQGDQSLYFVWISDPNNAQVKFLMCQLHYHFGIKSNLPFSLWIEDFPNVYKMIKSHFEMLYGLLKMPAWVMVEKYCTSVFKRCSVN